MNKIAEISKIRVLDSFQTPLQHLSSSRDAGGLWCGDLDIIILTTQSICTHFCQYTNNLNSEIDKITANKDWQFVFHATPETYLTICCLCYKEFITCSAKTPSNLSGGLIELGLIFSVKYAFDTEVCPSHRTNPGLIAYLFYSWWCWFCIYLFRYSGIIIKFTVILSILVCFAFTVCHIIIVYIAQFLLHGSSFLICKNVLSLKHGHSLWFW